MALGSIFETIDRIRAVEESVGDFIAGDGPNSDLANFARERYRRNCRSYSNAPDWLAGLGPAGQTVGRMCKRYLDENGWSDVGEGPPFTGGQCPVAYRVSGVVNTTRVADGVAQAFPYSFTAGGPPTTLTGPITGTTTAPGFGCSAGRTAAVALGAGGSYRLFGCFSDTQFTINSVTITGVQRVDGQPDSCGDPPSEIKPGPNPAPDPGPIPEEEEPRPNPEDPSIPDFPLPDFPDPVFGPTPFTGPDDGGGYDGPPAPTIGDPIENDDGTGGGDEDFGEPPEGEEWVGAFLELTDVPPTLGAIAGSGPENTVYPRVVGNASLYGGSTRYTADQVRSKWSDHFVELERLPVNGIRVSVLPDVRYRVYPVSLPVPEEE